MKRRFINTAIIASVLLATGCEPRIDPPQPEPAKADHFTASRENVGPQGATQWAEGDSIVIVSTGQILYASAGADSKASFSGPSVSDYETPVSAVYPASIPATMKDGMICLALSQEQYGDSFECPQAALSDGDGNMDFKAVCGIMEVSLEGCSDYSEIRLTTRGNESLWGNALIDPVTFDLKGFEGGSEAQKTLVAKRRSPSAGSGNSGTEWFSSNPGTTVTDGRIIGETPSAAKFYFVLPEGTLKDGYTITVIDSHRGFMQKDFDSVNIVRGRTATPQAIEYDDQSDVTVRTDVINKAFYKDIFMDSGIELSQNPSMPIVDFLGLQLEHMLASNNSTGLARQQRLLCGDADDLNGVLLYPDGAPRFKMIYVSGGGSNAHGLSLGETGRQAIRDFNFAGGSYIGSCAGAYVCSKGVFNYSTGYSDGFIGIYPGVLYRTSTDNIYTKHTIPDGSPILKYYDFGGKRTIDSVRHHNGPYFQEYYLVPGAEVITSFNYPSYRFHGHPAIVAYKENEFKGRVIPCGSHPEQVDHGDNLLLMAALAQYAFDGVGCARVKAVLRNGSVRVMDKSTSDNDPDYTMVGDLQCHHFAFALPAGAKNVRIRLTTTSSHRLSLRLAQDTFAFKEDAQYAAEGDAKEKELKFETLPAGTWYIGVQCEDTVKATKGTNEFTYKEKDVLNGVPYTISLTWE